MKNYISKLVFAVLLAAPLSSWALIEGRLSYGSLASGQNLSDVCQGSCTSPGNAPGIVPTYGAGLDVIIKLPIIPVGFGVRTEDMKLSVSGAGIDADIKYNRTAVIINYRIIDTIVHFGPIFTYGISHSGNMTLKEGGTTKVDLSPGTVSSYSVGLELLVKPLIVLPLTIGAEAGYMNFKWGQVTNSVDNTQKDIDLSGTYVKVFLGLDF